MEEVKSHNSYSMMTFVKQQKKRNEKNIKWMNDFSAIHSAIAITFLSVAILSVLYNFIHANRIQCLVFLIIGETWWIKILVQTIDWVVIQASGSV